MHQKFRHKNQIYKIIRRKHAKKLNIGFGHNFLSIILKAQATTKNRINTLHQT